MATVACKVTDVKSYEAELAVLDAELEAAHVANDPSRWLAAANAREELQIARFLAVTPPCPGDEPETSAPDHVDWPSELDRLYSTWYALGYDCATQSPAEDLGTLELWVARLAYDHGWKRGRTDRSTWLDELDWGHVEAEEAEVRGMLAGHPAWDFDEDDVEWSDDR